LTHPIRLIDLRSVARLCAR